MCRAADGPASGGGVTLQYTGLLIVAIAAFVAPVISGLIPRRLIPPVVLEVLAGLAIGPQGLDLVHAAGAVEVLYLMGSASCCSWPARRLRSSASAGPPSTCPASPS